MKNPILISIKPKFVEKIKAGEKIYEYRRVVPKDSDHLYIYSSYPIKRVVGEANFSIISDSLENLWNITKEHSGITKEFFDDYFKDKSIGYCLKLDNVVFYKESKTLESLGFNFAPQNYFYI